MSGPLPVSMNYQLVTLWQQKYIAFGELHETQYVIFRSLSLIMQLYATQLYRCIF